MIDQVARPLLRGWLHAVAIAPALVGAVALVVLTRGDIGRQVSVGVYGVTLTMLFTVSALYHRGGWSPRWRTVWRRLDHATIFMLIAGTYTPIVLNVLDGWMRVAMLLTIWAVAIAGAGLVASPLQLPRPLAVSLYLGVGWLALVITPVLYLRMGAGALVLLVIGGLLYSLGATAYALQRPQLWPRVFGYHEVFHLLVIVASAVFFAIITLTVVPTARV